MNQKQIEQFKQWAVDNDYQSSIEYNFDNHRFHGDSDNFQFMLEQKSIYSVLPELFDWSYTPEGFMHWADITQEWIRYTDNIDK